MIQYRLRLLTLAAALAIPFLVTAQTPANCTAAAIPVCVKGLPPGTLYRQIMPQAMPTSLTRVTAVDSYIDMLVITVPSGSGTTVLVQDAQGTPIPLVPTIVTAVNTVYILSFPAYYWAPGGFSVQASGSGVTWYASWRQ